MKTPREQSVKITALLLAPIAGDVPMLDALLEFLMARHALSIERSGDGHAGCAMAFPHRGMAPPKAGALPIPLVRRDADGWPVAACSSPIFVVRDDYQDRIVRRIDGGLLAAHGDLSRRRTIHHGTGATKAYYKPVRVRLVERVVWFAVAKAEKRSGCGRYRNPIATLRRRLRQCVALGKHTGAGYGRCLWEVEPVEEDWSWFAQHPDGEVLMRPLPVAAVGQDVVGYTVRNRAVIPPYWHPERYTECAEPC